jgi:hypothetical protein
MEIYIMEVNIMLLGSVLGLVNNLLATVLGLIGGLGIL